MQKVDNVFKHVVKFHLNKSQLETVVEQRTGFHLLFFWKLIQTCLMLSFINPHVRKLFLANSPVRVIISYI